MALDRTRPSTEGDIAHDAVDSGNPVKVGGKAASATPAVVAAADRTDAWFDLHGRLVTMPYHATPQSPATLTITASTTDTQVITAPGAGLSIWVVSIQAGNTSGTYTRLDLKEGSGGTVKKTMPLAASGGGYTATLGVPWKLAANTALYAASSVSVTDVRINIDYFIAP